MPTSFTVNTADLTYILKQIKIAEAHAGGQTLLQAIMDAYGVTAANAAQLPAGLRTVDGTYNNLFSEANANYGAADTLFPRLTTPAYSNEGDEGAGFAGVTNTNYGVGGNVVDSDPRIISNLIVDMSVNNPAAIEAFLSNPLAVAAFEEQFGYSPTAEILTDILTDAEANEILQTIPNQSPDIGLSPGFNAWMTFFGQFFDHGLDLVTKGGNGTVYVPLAADDPLIAGADGIFGNADDLPAQLRFMALTRANPTIVDGVPQHENTTTSWIDQNQTYTSHASHQVFLREYARIDVDGAGPGETRTYATGRLIDGTTAGGSVDGAIGNWAEVKAQALTMLGIRLSDFDVHNVPLLATDQYGRFIPGANGYAQLVMAPDGTHATNWLKEGTADGITTEGSLGTNHAFLNDIAHHASPSFIDTNHNGVQDGGEVLQTADSDPGVGDDHDANTYDDEMLNAHFITGDGRGNENIALTTVHSIFHSEHNRLVEANKATLLAGGDVAFLNEWLLVDQATNLTAAQVQALDPDSLVWDGERLFQAARFGTEMQYQHLVFEEFARRIQPMVDPFVFNNSPNIDPSIVAEFAHTVYRFGHSMLTGTVDRLDNNLDLLNGDPDQQTLLAVFLNPQAYIGSGATLEEINANIIRGLSRDVGNAIDEFIVTDVRSNLLGLPLDLAALNISRGRDTGIPSLNETRAQLYDDTGFADLKPYESWTDFALNMKNAASLVNFIAAYGTHDTIEAATTLAGKRAAAELLVFGGAGEPADRLDFLNATGDYAADGPGGNDDSLGGLNYIDLWIGGLAEASPEFGGMLGTTFNYVFEAQMENLQFGDRLYYLTRTQGLNFVNQLEPNTFADLVMRNTDLGDPYATHLNGQLFTTPDHIIELDRGIAQEDYNGAASGLDPLWEGLTPAQIAVLGPKIARAYSGPQVDGHDVGGTLRAKGGEHYVLGGTEGNDKIYGDKGIDTLWGDGGDDYLNGGTESDDVFGGEGNDIIEDPFGDDVLRGMQGNDVITSARGADLMFGGEGSDYIVLGQDAGEVFAGTGTDFVLGGLGGDVLMGNEGDDWMEGAGGFDTLAGDNSELFFNSLIIGHDVLFGQGDETDYDGESGDDIMASGASVFRYEGMFGFDWGIGKGDNAGVNFDLAIKIFTSVPDEILRDRFDKVEALSGWKFNDHLDGDNRGAPALGGFLPGAPDPLFDDDILNQAGIDRITGFGAWMGGARQTLFGPGVTDFRDGNILMGGDGNDVIQGRGGFDLIDGDSWLNVRIGIVVNGVHYSAESMNTDKTVAGIYAGKVYNVDANGDANFNSIAFGGRSLTSLMLDRTISPGDMSIIREIKLPGSQNGSDDTAVYRGTLAEYDIEGRVTSGPNGTGTLITQAHDVDGDGFIMIRDRDDGVVGATITGPDGQPLTLRSRGILTDNTDLIKNIEHLQFSDVTIDIVGPPVISDLTPTEGQQLSVNTSSVTDANGVGPFSYQWQSSTNGTVWTNIGGATASTFTPQDLAGMTFGAQAGLLLRVVVSFTDGAGNPESRFSNATGPVGVNWLGNGAANVLNGTAGDDIGNGADGADTLNGNAGDDVLTGGNGNDILRGGLGIDRTIGGDGNDQHFVDSAADIIVEGVGEGTADRVVASTSYTLASGVDVEQMLTDNAAGLSAINLTGNELANDITGNAGVNILDGGSGNDILRGGGGADQTIGGTGDDQHYVDNAGDVVVEVAGGGTADRVLAMANYTLNAGAEVEQLSTDNINATTARNLTGNEFANAITGNAGANVLDGGGGNDNINGYLGNDTIVQTGATGGRDMVNGNVGNDTYQLNGVAGAETFNIYTRAAAVSAGMTGIAANTEIVITRNGVGNAFIIAELDNIEELVVNALTVSSPGGSGGGANDGDTVNVFGNFNATSLNFNTITVNGSSGNDTVNISGLASAHRLVFNAGEGDDSVTGTLRPQDIVVDPDAASAGASGTQAFDGGQDMIAAIQDAFLAFDQSFAASRFNLFPQLVDIDYLIA